MLTAVAVTGYVPTDGEASGEEEEACKRFASIVRGSGSLHHAAHRNHPKKKASTTVTPTRTAATLTTKTRRRRAKTGMCVAQPPLSHCLGLIACTLQELEEEAKRADKTAYEDSDDDRKRKGGGGGGKSKPPPAKKSKY